MPDRQAPRFSASCLGLLALLAANSPAFASIQALDSKYAALSDRISSDPDEVLKTLLADADTNRVGLDGAQLFLVLGDVYDVLTYPAESIAAVDQGLSLITPAAEPWLFHKLQLVRARGLDRSGQASKAYPAAESALEWARSANDAVLEIDALTTRGLLGISTLDYLGALDDLQHAYELAPEQGERQVKAAIAGLVALVYEYRSEDALAIPYFEEALAYQREQGNLLEVSIALYGLGRAHKRTDAVALGERYLIESGEIARAIGDDQGLGYALKELAGIAQGRGDYALARSQLLEAGVIFGGADNAFMRLDVAKSLAQIAIETGDLNAAREHLAAAREALLPEGMPLQSVTMDIIEARLLAASGDFEGAYELLRTAAAERRRLVSLRSTEQFHEMRSRFELQARESENMILERDNQLQRTALAASEQRSRLLTALLIAGGLLIVTLSALIHRSRRHRQRLERIANTDALTGLPNRRRTLVELSARLGAESPAPWCAAILDLDHFKQINDTHGHLAGDQVLRRFTEICRGQLRDADFFGRIGGEEFLVILEQTEVSEAYRQLEQLRGAIHTAENWLADAELAVSVSVGVCAAAGNDNVSRLLARADRFLYRAKQSGRNRVITEAA